jgi:hypothetical protein
MTPHGQLAAKLAQYQSAFEAACRGLFAGGPTITVALDDEFDDAEPQAPPLAGAAEPITERSAAPVAGAVPDGASADPSAVAESSAAMAATNVDLAAVKREIEKALQNIATDFAHEFNARLMEAAEQDPSVEMVAPRYVMGPEHVGELRELLRQPVRKLLARLDAGEAVGARQTAADAWTALERRIRSKWQAYFVMTFQDVSVERKAAVDRKRLQPSVDPATLDALDRAEAARRTVPEVTTGVVERVPRRRLFSPWIAILALVVLAAAGGWLLFREHHRAMAEAEAAAKLTQPSTPAAPLATATAPSTAEPSGATPAVEPSGSAATAPIPGTPRARELPPTSHH